MSSQSPSSFLSVLSLRLPCSLTAPVRGSCCSPLSAPRRVPRLSTQFAVNSQPPTPSFPRNLTVSNPCTLLIPSTNFRPLSCDIPNPSPKMTIFKCRSCRSTSFNPCLSTVPLPRWTARSLLNRGRNSLQLPLTLEFLGWLIRERERRLGVKEGRSEEYWGAEELSRAR